MQLFKEDIYILLCFAYQSTYWFITFLLFPTILVTTLIFYIPSPPFFFLHTLSLVNMTSVPWTPFCTATGKSHNEIDASFAFCPNCSARRHVTTTTSTTPTTAPVASSSAPQSEPNPGNADEPSNTNTRASSNCTICWSSLICYLAVSRCWSATRSSISWWYCSKYQSDGGQQPWPSSKQQS